MGADAERHQRLREPRNPTVRHGQTVAQVIVELGISQPTYNRWRNKYGMMSVAEVKRLRALEKENQRLKTIVADQALDIAMLKEVAQGNW